MIKVDIKPLSVNRAWVGRLKKTSLHKKYIRDLSLIMPSLTICPDSMLEVFIEWGFSSKASDIDNPIKPFLDALESKYGFNDKNIARLILEKKIVKRGEEYIKFDIKRLNDK